MGGAPPLKKEVKKMRRIKIAVIDSGCSLLDGRIVLRHSIFEDELVGEDEIGHGNAVISILLNRAKSSDIYSFKIFKKDYKTKEKDLVNVLTYINEKLDVDVVHISNGINYYDTQNALQKVINKLENKHVIVLSAADNLGSISYPAAFENVIGVFWDTMYADTESYTYVENSSINILGYGNSQLLPWKNGEKKIVSGSSFAAPYITSKVSNYLSLFDERKSLREVLSFLKNLAIRTINFKSNNYKKLSWPIEKSVLFPVNKETHALLGNKDLLVTNIINTFDIPYSKSINKNVAQIVYGNSVIDGKVQSINNIDWESDFDTIITGHLKKVNELCKIDYTKYILGKCLEYKKNIFMFDSIKGYENFVSKLNENGNDCFSPYIYRESVFPNNFGSLYKCNVPVTAVIGTSSSQGKFNLQLAIRRILLNYGYEVGQISTEPSGYLFGMDFTYANGYGSDNNLKSEEEIYLLNYELRKMESNKDIVIVGTQSQIIPYSFGNIGFYSLSQINILLALDPDVYVLCINFNDDLDYIKRIIQYIKCYFKKDKIILSLYPFDRNRDWSINNSKSQSADLDLLKAFVNKVRHNFRVNCYINGLEDKKLVDEMLEHYS